MSVEVKINAEIQFGEVSVREQVAACFNAAATSEAFLSQDFVAGLSSQFEDAFGSGVVIEGEDIEDCTVFSSDGSVLLLSLEGRGGFVLLKKVVDLFKDKIEEVFIIECIDYNCDFYVYDHKKEWLNCSRSARIQFEMLLDDFDIRAKEKLSKLVHAYKAGTIAENGKLSIKDIFSKIANPKIDPYNDSYIFEIEDPEIRDENGETVITAAVKSENIEVVFYLVQQLTPRLIVMENEKGETPLALARAGSNEKMLKMVEEFSKDYLKDRF